MKEVEFSGAKQAEILSDVKKWSKACESLPAYAALPKETQAVFLVVTCSFAALMYTNHQKTPGQWTAAALEELLTETLPYKKGLPPIFFDAVEPALTILFDYMQEAGLLKNHKTLITRLHAIAPKMHRRAEEAPRDVLNESGAFPLFEGKQHRTKAAPAPSAVSAQSEPTLAQWEKLYDAAKRIRQLAPWDDMWDADLITLMLPGRKEPVFCSIMGRNGECYDISIYPGLASLRGFFRITTMPEGSPPWATLFEQDCFVCYYGDREELTPKERATLKTLGLRFHGRGEWIYFRHVEPGYYPWHINAEQADLLIQVLQNCAMACMQLRRGELSVDFERGETLLRFYSPEKELWLNTAAKLPPIPKETFPLSLLGNDLSLARLKKHKRSAAQLEFEITYLPRPVQESREERPYFPRLLLLISKSNGIILDQNIVEHDRTEEAVLDMLAAYIETSGRPAAIHVRDMRTGRYIADFCKKIGIALVEGQGVPITDAVLNDLGNFLESTE